MAPATNQAFLPLDDVPGAADRRVWLRLHELGRTSQLPAGHRVIRPDRVPASVHVVVAGLLIVETLTPDGKEIALGLLERGTLFGEAALLPTRPGDDPAYVPEVRTVTPARVLSIGAVELQNALRGDENLRAWVDARLVERIRRSEALLVRSRSGSVRHRLEALLCELTKRTPEATGHTPAPLTQEMLAKLVGATRESVNRAVASLVLEGRLVRVGRSYAPPLTVSRPAGWPVRTDPPRDRRDVEPAPRPRA
jgi:CRP-like cAMP-binding protein